MNRDSVLTDIDKQSIEINKLIFHIIIKEDIKPIFLDEVVLNISQEEFFKKRFIDASLGSHFIFEDKETSNVFNDCKLITEDVESNFLAMSKKLTASFKSHHKKSMSDGVFVVSLITISGNKEMIFLVKLDHKLVYQYKLDGSRATLEEIKNTFTEDKKAIQKVALIDMSNSYNWHVIASERNKDGIRDYFKSFLQVKEKEDRYTLTDKTRRIARRWASDNKELLPTNTRTTTYRTRAIEYLISRTIFNSDEFIDFLIIDDDKDRRKKAKASLKKYLQAEGIYGQVFKPSHKALTPAKKRNVGQTAEGITLQWDGNEEDVNMDIPKEKNPIDDMYHITIITSDVKYLN